MSSKYLTKPAILFAFTMIGSITVYAQGNDSLIQQRIRQQQYVFVPLSCSSPSFTTAEMSRDYKLEIKSDSFIVNLPYYGKSYTPQHGRADDDVIVFASTDFEYAAVPKKKGKWEITIKPKEAKGVRFFLTIFSDGEAQMDVTNPRRETMLFKGYVW